MNTLLLITGAVSAGILLGYFLRVVMSLVQKGSVEIKIKQRLMVAKEEAQKITDSAQKKALEREEKLEATENRLIKKEELLDIRQNEIDKEHEELRNQEIQIKKREEEVSQEEDLVTRRLESITELSREDAKQALLIRAEEEFAEDIEVRKYKLNSSMKDSLDEKAREILISTIQRLASPTTSELTTSSVAIQNEDIKGKIIGKEGRNIRAFERVAGVELIVDDAPGYITISSFDPVRRAIATKALEELIKDGRIQPAKIEELVQKAQNEINETMKQKGSEAVFELGIYGFDPRLVSVLGRLHFRTSYGQNVLQHSIECSHLAGILASELGADVNIAKAGALVHDIGKALDHEVQGSHVDIGIRILRRFNADERIITAMKSHHDDCPHETVEAVIVQTADIISGSRPGARRDTAENYLKRLQELEGLASRFSGVEKAFAIQAGREIRIFVQPENVSDLQAKSLARKIAIEIEHELRYPGEIKVTIIRETRIIDFAR